MVARIHCQFFQHNGKQENVVNFSREQGNKWKILKGTEELVLPPEDLHNMRLIFKLGIVHPLCINERLTYIQCPTLLVLPCVFVLLSCIMLCNAF